jgi:polyisoprenyl-phosphate glycosyltransferase
MISVVVPIFDEELLVRRLHAEIASAMEKVGLPWEAVYVDDGSRDRSLEILLDCQKQDGRIVVVELSRNWGHQAALTAGLTVARGDAVVLIDGDFQDPPAVIGDLVAAWKQGAEVVVAVRRSRAEWGLRGLLLRLFYHVFEFLSDFPLPLHAGTFGLLDRQAVDAVNRMGETNRYLPGLRGWVGFRTNLVYYDRVDRAAGEPKQKLWRLFKYGLDAIFSFSYKPLRLSLLLGLFAAFLSLLLVFVFLVCRLLGVGLFGQPVVVGYTSMIVAVLLLAGVQLMSIGVLGEYIGRIYDEVKRRPLFLVRKLHQDRAVDGARTLPLPRDRPS